MPFMDYLGDADVLNIEVSFCQKPQTLGVLAVLAYGDALVFRVDCDDCHFFAVRSFGYANFLTAAGFRAFFMNVLGLRCTQLSRVFSVILSSV